MPADAEQREIAAALNQGNYEKAQRLLQPLAEKGNAEAQYNLGFAYARGKNPEDLVKAREWYEKAAAQGYAGAQYNLGLMYYSGLGGAQDSAKAREWLEKAAAQTENAENTEAVHRARQVLEQIRQVR